LIEDSINPAATNVNGVDGHEPGEERGRHADFGRQQHVLRIDHDQPGRGAAISSTLGQPLGLVTGGTTVASRRIADYLGVAIDDEQLNISGSGYVGSLSGSSRAGCLHLLSGSSAFGAPRRLR
jgi:hypothetical protein